MMSRRGYPFKGAAINPLNAPPARRPSGCVYLATTSMAEDGIPFEPIPVPAKV